MIEFDLFTWWAISISGGSVFLTLVSIYLYANSRKKRKKDERMIPYIASLARDFVFVWVLLSLLIFYIVSIRIGRADIFALGNIVIEALLIIYLIKNKTGKSEEEK